MVRSSTPSARRGTARRGTCETRVLLADGRSVELRAIRPSDERRLRRFHDALSDDSVRSRFLAAHPHLRADEAHRLTRVDGHRRGAVVAIDGPRIVGVGRYEPTGTRGSAELGLVVADRYQGVGLGAALLREVARAAGREGYVTLVAATLGSNRRMLRLLVGSGLPRSVTHAGELTTVTLRLGGDHAPA